MWFERYEQARAEITAHLRKIMQLQKENEDLKLQLLDRTEKYRIAMDKGVWELWDKNEKLTKALEVAEEKIQLACEPRRQRDLSQLASNPPRNGAVYDIQVMLQEALEQIEKIKNESK